jgi:hypothetical protein
LHTLPVYPSAHSFPTWVYGLSMGCPKSLHLSLISSNWLSLQDITGLDGESYGGELYVSSSVSRNNSLISSLFVHAKIQTYTEPSVSYGNNHMCINVMKTAANCVTNSALRSAMPHTEKIIPCLYSPLSFRIPYRFFVVFQNFFHTHTYIHVYIQV